LVDGTLAITKSAFPFLDRNRSGNQAIQAASPDLIHREGVWLSSAVPYGTEAILVHVIAQRDDLGHLKWG
jgi:hypothetical protein